jgi:hypothetical protein
MVARDDTRERLSRFTPERLSRSTRERLSRFARERLSRFTGERLSRRPCDRLSRLRRRAAALLLIERLLAAGVPATCVLLAYLAAAAFGLANSWLWLAAIIAILALLAYGIWPVRAASALEIDRRIEAASGLRHGPLAALDDHAALGDTALFARHQARMRAALEQARAGGLNPVVSRADPFSLRAGAALLLIVGLISAGAAGPQRVLQAFMLPDWPFPGPGVQAWIDPPGYTGQPPSLLTPGQTVTVLTGTHLGVILSGSTAGISFAGTALSGPPPADGGRRADGVITRSGRLLVGPWWHRLATADITAVPPAAPRLALAPPQLRGTDLHLDIQADDAYGLASLGLSISPVGHPGALPDVMALPAQTGHSAMTVEEADSPYAGLTVMIVLRAANLAGMTAVTPSQAVQLPATPHRDATARAMALLRQRLALSPADTGAAGVALGALSRHPPSAITYAADLQMAALGAALAGQRERAADAVDRMTALIHQLDDGPAFAADQALAAASRALSQTLAHGGTQAQLDAALQKLDQALAAKLAAGGAAPSAAGQAFDTGSLQRQAEQIAADERAGNIDKAKAELAQLQQMLQQLQTAQPMSAAQAQRAQAAEAAQRRLSQIIQGQGAVLDKTGQGTATPADQGQLRQGLQSIQTGLEKAGMGGIPGLQAAGHAMSRAQQALGQGQPEVAAGAEAQAIAAMQQAAAALKSQAGNTLGFGGSSPTDQSGADGTGQDNAIPGLDLEQSSPARKIQMDIMHRDEEPDLAPATHQYLHRLLNP